MAEKDPSLTLVWFRRDLRLHDNEALVAAAKRGRILPVYLWSDEDETPWKQGGACRWWIHHSLNALAALFAQRQCPLIIQKGRAEELLPKLVSETGATAVYWNRLYDPHLIERDARLKARFSDEKIEAKSFAGCMLHEPTKVQNKQGKPFQVFSPFWRHLLTLCEPEDTLPIPPISSPEFKGESLPVDQLGLLPKIRWDAGLEETWTPGEKGARQRLEGALERTLDRYMDDRNRPDLEGTSRLSPHLHHGELSPRDVWVTVRAAQESMDLKAHRDSADWFLRELGWREFNHHLLYHFPHTPTEPLREEFKKFPWNSDSEKLRAWQKGLTGYPIVDAGMRQLYATGWMHNRVRMIVASFLVKHLLQPWQDGAAWFWDTLVDADLANNTMGWQWAAGCGADAAPYFRIFNPVTQAENFDPKGEYIRRWIPELKAVNGKAIFAPQQEADSLFKKNQSGYPTAIVDHKKAREAALDAFAAIKKPKSS